MGLVNSVQMNKLFPQKSQSLGWIVGSKWTQIMQRTELLVNKWIFRTSGKMAKWWAAEQQPFQHLVSRHGTTELWQRKWGQWISSTQEGSDMRIEAHEETEEKDFREAKGEAALSPSPWIHLQGKMAQTWDTQRLLVTPETSMERCTSGVDCSGWGAIGLRCSLEEGNCPAANLEMDQLSSELRIADCWVQFRSWGIQIQTNRELSSSQ